MKSYPSPVEIFTVSRSSLALTDILFFGSAVAALLYQIAWQRMLFGWYGVDLDSVSAIVAIFMLGLGLGALTGAAGSQTDFNDTAFSSSH
jgi:hypothetical protein